MKQVAVIKGEKDSPAFMEHYGNIELIRHIKKLVLSVNNGIEHFSIKGIMFPLSDNHINSYHNDQIRCRITKTGEIYISQYYEAVKGFSYILSEEVSLFKLECYCVVNGKVPLPPIFSSYKKRVRAKKALTKL